ncbi:hypothetical protein VHA01S_030_00130 [Vibrio halioticoli NBRC 102217]|uniref:WGR domain-containing protein n=1 Tax=Vibrio halioticoli NBRC 102217 TaxID=1219072 RepID=V5FE62_9VIBR|nr:hypothetical protein [Vibrio halioticoli]GAD89938.1 hypothetical protein VHA01S_030_00130 [Vibrio halioticoli NBRC 102217]
MIIAYRKDTRYYALSLERDMFNWCVCKSYGGTYGRAEHRRKKPFDDFSSAFDYFESEHERRLKRGYHIIE